MHFGPSSPLAIYPSTVKILMLGTWAQPAHLDFLAKLPRLQALSVELRHQDTSLHSLPTQFTHVSHLQLRITSLYFLTQQIDFRSIRYLSLDIQFPGQNINRQLFLKNWTFRSLQTLSLSTTIEHYTSEPNWIAHFLLRHQESLLELSISNVEDSAHRLVPHITSIVGLFDYCPDITTMGISIHIFDFMRISESWAPKSSNKRRTLFIHGLQPGAGLSPGTLAPLFPLKEHWRVDRIVFSLGWDDLGITSTLVRRWGTTFIRWRLSEILDALEDIGIPIFDQYGASLWGFIEQQRKLWESEAL
ncbi:hypothetical protein CPB86DRAFT_816856 [Serendipita vermifera]|nr:hypothetical protein CPB86DRAFT_816856 [Serendipita vermifera]